MVESANPSAGNKQNEPELEKRSADETERQFRFERRLRLLELKERRKDRELRRLEIDHSAGRGVRFTTAQATVAAAVLAFVSAIVGGLIQGWSTRDVETTRSNAQLEIERTRVQGTIDLEQQKQRTSERLAEKEFETTLILKAIEAPLREDQIKNLKFFINAGFINDEDGKIAEIDDNDFPSLPRQDALSGKTIIFSVNEIDGATLKELELTCTVADGVLISQEGTDGLYSGMCYAVEAAQARQALLRYVNRSTDNLRNYLELGNDFGLIVRQEGDQRIQAALALATPENSIVNIKIALYLGLL